MRPNRLPSDSMNHSAPPGPEVIASGKLPAVGSANSWNCPPVVTRPILPAFASVNQVAPSGPEAIARGPLSAVGIGSSRMEPASARVRITNASQSARLANPSPSPSQVSALDLEDRAGPAIHDRDPGVVRSSPG